MTDLRANAITDHMSGGGSLNGAIPVLLAAALFLDAGPLACAAGMGRPLEMQDLSRWSFDGGEWRSGKDGTMRPPEKFADYYTAFYLPESYRDLDADFEFRLENIFCDAGLAVHARDARHYYLVHFPTVGQQWRVKHFWVAISRVDESGYKRMLKLAMVPQVDANLFTWHRVKVGVHGNELTVTIDGHHAATATDPGLSAPGRMGVAGFQKFGMRNLELVGDLANAAAWGDPHTKRNWFQPCPDATYGKWQYPPSIVKTPGGDLLMSFQATNAAEMTEESHVNWLLARSRDGGRHWSKPEKVTANWPADIAVKANRYGTLFVTRDRRLMFQYQKSDHLYMAESKDDGHTWGDVWRAQIQGEWIKDPNELYAYGPVLVLRDGTLLRAFYGIPSGSAPEPYEFDWGALHSRAFASRSEDGGKTWSAPVDMDGSRAIEEVDKPRSTTLDLTESSCVQVNGGDVRCLIRPHNSPFMWAAESGDGGRSWGSVRFGAFPGYAANAFYTSAHVFLVSHRMPGLAINTSLDDGLNWDQGTIVGSDIWAMGDMVEVTPGVVFFAYMDSQRSFLRAQFIRVTSAGLQPVFEMLPDSP